MMAIVTYLSTVPADDVARGLIFLNLALYKIPKWLRHFSSTNELPSLLFFYLKIFIG